VFDSERRPLVDVQFAAASSYVFRGQTFTEKPVLQLDGLVQLPTDDGGRAQFGVFGNLDLRDDIGTAWASEGHARDFTQVDFVGGYARTFGTVEFAAGVRHYQWAFGDTFRFAPFPSTTELYAQAGVPLFGGQTGLELHQDVDEARSLYARLRHDHSVRLNDRWSLAAAAWLGWSSPNHGEWLYRTHEAGFADLGASLSLVRHLDELTTARVSLHGSTIVADDYRDWFQPRIDADVLWVTASIGWAF